MCRPVSVQLVMLVFPNPRADRYDTIKTFLTRRMPLPSQCILTKTISREQGLMSVCSKVLVQIQAKIGGQPWRVGPALPSTMVRWLSELLTPSID